MNDIANVNLLNSLRCHISPQNANIGASNQIPDVPQPTFNPQSQSFDDPMGHMHQMAQMAHLAQMTNSGGMPHGIYNTQYGQPSGYSYGVQAPGHPGMHMQPSPQMHLPHPGMHAQLSPGMQAQTQGYPGLHQAGYSFLTGDFLGPGSTSHLSSNLTPAQLGFGFAHAHSPGPQAPPDSTGLGDWHDMTAEIPDNDHGQMTVDSGAPGSFLSIPLDGF